MNLRNNIRRILKEEVNDPFFFLRRVNLDEVKKRLSSYSQQVFYETESFGQFKYELTLRVVEAIMWNKYKMDWEDLPEDFLDLLALVKHGEYTRIDTPSAVRQVGVSAQSLQKALAVAVSENDQGFLSVAYGNAALVACIQLAKRVINLELELKKLNEEK